MSFIITLPRVYLPTETLGSMYHPSGALLCKTMELPLRWRDKEKNLTMRNISCIPEGDWEGIREAYTVKHPYPHLRLPNVPGRSGILVHRVKYVHHLKGCIGVGMAFKDFNNDGVPDMDGSKVAMQELYDSLPDKFILRITQKALPPVANIIEGRGK